MVGNDVVIFLLAVVGTVCVLIVFYYILICISSSRINKTISTVQRVRSRQQQQQPSSSSDPGSSQARVIRPTTITRSIQSHRLPQADENAYILGPTATAAESQRDFRSGRPHRTGGGGHRVSVPGTIRIANENGSLMRFYTAEELQDFPFDEHIEALRRQIEDEEEMRRHNLASINACMHPIDYNGRRATVPSMNHGGESFSDPDSDMVYPPDFSSGPPVTLRRPSEIVLDPTDRIAIDQIQSRSGHRTRTCYSIPTCYIGRPPAYLANYSNEEDPPPNYHEAVKLTQIKEEEAHGGSAGTIADSQIKDE